MQERRQEHENIAMTPRGRPQHPQKHSQVYRILIRTRFFK